MKRPNQERISIRLRMLERNLSFTQLAKLTGHARPTISKAVNHGRFPRVLSKVKGVLNG